MTHLFHVLKSAEGGPGYGAIDMLKANGIKCRKGPESIYIGHICIEVTGNSRVAKRASRLLWG